MAAKPRRKPPQRKTRKVVDESMVVRSKSKRTGLVREEVWVGLKNEVVKYNLAYINFDLCQSDNGRVLGYDNAHGFHERHSMGEAKPVAFSSYKKTAKAFFAEVKKLKEEL